MTTYLIMLLLCGLVGALFHVLYQKSIISGVTSKKFGVASFALILSIVEGLRGVTVGTDTVAYVEMFLHADEITVEAGFKFFCQAIRYFTSSPTVFLFIAALLINGLVAIACFRLSEHPLISMFLWVFLYYYFISYNALRQYIAIAIMMNGFYYANRRKWIMYAICLAAAMSFHQSAMIGIVFFIIAIVDTPRNRHGFVVAGVVILFATIPLAWSLLEELVIKYFPKYGRYIAEETIYVTKGGGIRQSIINIAVCGSFMFLVGMRNESRYKYDAILVVAVMFSILQMWVRIFDRFLWYFEVFSIIAIPEVTKDDNIKVDYNSKNMYIAVVLGAACLYMLYYLYSGVHRVTPYVMASVNW